MKHAKRLTVVLIGMMTLAACNTVEGAGEDLRSAGDAIAGDSGKKK